MLPLALTLLKRHVVSPLVLSLFAHSVIPALGKWNSPALAEYQPAANVTGLIRVWGSTEMGGVLRLWQEGFRRHQPQVVFENHLHSTVSSIAGLYTGVADLSLLGRDIWATETTAFESVLSYKPTGIQVGTGSYDVPRAAYALVVYVHRSNPLSRLTLAQLAAAFGVPTTPGARSIRTWGELGLSGSWAGAPLHTYNFEYENDKAIFFRRTVFGTLYKWKDSTLEFSNLSNGNGAITDSGRLILDTLAKDPLGIAISNPYYANREVKALALSRDGIVYTSAARDTVAARAYPLTRAVWIYIDRKPRRPPARSISEFLRYVLSRQGQESVAADGSYLPLTKPLVEDQLSEIGTWSN
jgi:phosphate transport system substrate-binding protein